MDVLDVEEDRGRRVRRPVLLVEVGQVGRDVESAFFQGGRDGDGGAHRSRHVFFKLVAAFERGNVYPALVPESGLDHVRKENARREVDNGQNAREETHRSPLRFHPAQPLERPIIIHGCH